MRVVEHKGRGRDPARVVSKMGGERDPVGVEGLFASGTGSGNEEDGLGLGRGGAVLAGQAGIEEGFGSGKGWVEALRKSLHEGRGGDRRSGEGEQADNRGELHLGGTLLGEGEEEGVIGGGGGSRRRRG